MYVLLFAIYKYSLATLNIINYLELVKQNFPPRYTRAHLYRGEEGRKKKVWKKIHVESQR